MFSHTLPNTTYKSHLTVYSCITPYKGGKIDIEVLAALKKHNQASQVHFLEHEKKMTRDKQNENRGKYRCGTGSEKAVAKMLDSLLNEDRGSLCRPESLDQCWFEVIHYLWLRQHVQTPGAHLAISGDANQVVSILGAHHIDAVNWVLRHNERRAF